jgi:hypothetical protein
MTTNRKRLTGVLAFALALALVSSVAAACYGSNPLDPNYVPRDSTQKDTTPGQG